MQEENMDKQKANEQEDLSNLSDMIEEATGKVT